MWDQLFTDDNLLLGSRKTPAELSTLHPDPVQIFQLWQIYLNNVDPLLKVTHTPTLQPRLIEAASNMANISPTLGPLMFSIYSMAVTSLTTDECQTTFGSAKEDLLTRYQFGCQQALMNCGYLRTGDRECLTAFYLFLVRITNDLRVYLLTRMKGLHRTRHRSSISIVSAWRRTADCAAYRNSQRDGLYQVQRSRGGNAAQTLVVPQDFR